MASSRSWHARFSVLTYLQIMVFYNLFTLLSLPAQVLHIRTLVMQLLLDEQLEVTNTLFISRSLLLRTKLRLGRVQVSQRQISGKACFVFWTCRWRRAASD